jgi:hypothetical protein
VDDEALARLVRQLIREDRLPNFPAGAILASYGDGTICSVCSTGIRSNDVMYELRFAGGAVSEFLRMHFRCFMAWERAIGRATP